MSEINKTEETDVRRYPTILALLYTAVSCAMVFSSVSGISATGIETVLATRMAFPFLTMLFYYLYLHSLGENARRGALLIIIPTVLCPVLGYMTGNSMSALYAIFDILSPTIAAGAVYYAFKTNGRVSSACASASFLMLISTLLETLLPLYALSLEVGISVKTLLFDSLSAYIEEVKLIYVQTINSTMSMLGEEQITAAAQSTEYLESMLVTLIALSPAIMCAINFFYVLIFTKISDRISTAFGITKKPSFGRFEVGGITNFVFNITATIIMLSILFENGMSDFTCGVLSILIAVLPNYLILGVRRIFRKLRRVLSKGVAVLIVILIIVAGFMLSYYLLLLVLSFFGTSEYRAQKYGTDKE